MPRTEEAHQQEREASKRKILDAALAVFAKKGSRATMAEVADEAGVSQGLAYRTERDRRTLPFSRFYDWSSDGFLFL